MAIPITVLVTGGTGFLGSHIIIQLLRLGYRVNTTVRDLKVESNVRKWIGDSENLSFFAADLIKDEGWEEAARGCTYVLHVASPFPSTAPKDDDELIVPAREGTLRVLRAAREAGVKRVVLTSSFAAIGYGHYKDLYTEEHWSELDAIPTYHKSKTLAEKAAWESGFELAVINPVGIFGPVLSRDLSSSIQLIQKLMNMSACPKMYFSVVDVRDLAELHVLAMTKPKAKNERFIAASDGGPLSFMDVGKIIQQAGQKGPKREVPNWLVRLAAMFDSTARQIVPQLGERKFVSNEKAKKMLGWKPRPVETTISDTVQSLVELGLV